MNGGLSPNFTIKAQEALQNAQEIASRESHGEFKAIHLLAALIMTKVL